MPLGLLEMKSASERVLREICPNEVTARRTIRLLNTGLSHSFAAYRPVLFDMESVAKGAGGDAVTLPKNDHITA